MPKNNFDGGMSQESQESYYKELALNYINSKQGLASVLDLEQEQILRIMDKVRNSRVGTYEQIKEAYINSIVTNLKLSKDAATNIVKGQEPLPSAFFTHYGGIFIIKETSNLLIGALVHESVEWVLEKLPENRILDILKKYQTVYEYYLKLLSNAKESKKVLPAHFVALIADVHADLTVTGYNEFISNISSLGEGYKPELRVKIAKMLLDK